MMKVGSLFSGIGGLDLGLERAGLGRTVWQVERDPYCRSVLAQHWPDARQYDDVTTVNWADVEPVEVICGGFPCQPFSVAGDRRGTSDERWMWPAFADAIRVVGPRVVVLENVPALLADADAFGWVLSDLDALGFHAEWDVLPASAFGAPHRRERLFVVAYTTGPGLEGRIFAEPTRAPQRVLAGGLGRAGASWPDAPRLPRVGYGAADWVDRIRACGNAVVPSVAEHVGRCIMSSGVALAEPLAP